MGFEPEFLTMMPDTVTIEPCTGRDTYNDKVFGPAVSYRARITGKILALRRDVTEDLSVIFDVYIYSNGNRVTPEDRLTLPATGEWVDRTPMIFAVAHYTDPDGRHHTKVQCGWMYHRQGQ